jgi:DNA-binding NtrC family response regulator
MRTPVEVMVVDDEPTVGERLKDHLGRKGFAVEVFTESQKAIDRLTEKHFDVVITDLRMEGPSGLDVLQYVRGRRFSTQVIIITGYGSMETARHAEYTGAFDFINKPFNFRTIEAMTRKAAKKARRMKDPEAV